MALKLLTFLGPGDYQLARYMWRGKYAESDLFATALVGWLEPDMTIVFLTEKARKSANWRKLQQRLDAMGVQYRDANLPDGRSEAEYWDVFDRVVDHVDPGDELVFDYTHGFRSLPLLALLAAVYLRTALGVRVKHLLYGAMEARDANGVAPVLDLQEALGLLDWLVATEQFMKFGSAQALAGLLREAQQDAVADAPASKLELPTKLKPLASTMDRLSDALLLSRPLLAGENAHEACKLLHASQTEAQHWAKPVGLLLAGMERELGALRGDALEAQRRMVAWYLQHGHVLQAVTLAREWLVSWTAQELDGDEITDRAEVEAALNAALRLKQGKYVHMDPRLLQPLYRLTQYEQLLEAWEYISVLRNDLAHCGMRRNPRRLAAIRGDAGRCLAQLEQFSLRGNA